MRYAQLTYWTENLGDTVQSVAAAQYLPRIDAYVDRDRVADTRLDQEHFVICNGWWMHRRCGRFEFPPDPSVVPLLVSVHIAAAFRPHMTAPMFRYLERHGPVGCRDRGTQQFLDRHGIPNYYSSCLTLTLPRSEVPRSNEVILVDIDPALQRRLPPHVLRHATTATHTLEFPSSPAGVTSAYTRRREAHARALLERYAAAHLVVTSRIHCALPCLALGTPVVFLFEDPAVEWERLGPIRDFLRIHTDVDSVDWEPAVPDVSPVAQPLRRLVSRAVALARNPLHDGFDELDPRDGSVFS